MRRLRYGLPLLVVLFSLSSTFMPHKAFAAMTGTVQDASTITVGDQVYFDDKLDSDYTYVLQGGNSSCAKITRQKGDLTSGTIYVPNATNVGHCTQEPISLSPASATQIGFVWKDPSTITTSDGRRVYLQNAQSSWLYVETNDQVVDGKGCEDSVSVNNPSADTTATLTMRTEELSSVNQSSYLPGEMKTATTTGKKVNGCYEFTATVQIAPLNDASSNTGSTHGASSGGSGAGAHDSNATCYASGISFAWMLCGIYNATADFSDWLFSHLVQPMLRNTPISTDPSACAHGQGDCTYQIWSTFRVYGDIFLVIALLVVVFGQSIGGGLIDAYSAKKILPRLLGAAILINLSVYIVAGLVDLTNILGAGIGNLLTAPLNGAGAFNFSLSNWQGNIIGAGTTITAGLTFIAVGFGAIPPISVILLFLVMPVVFGLLAAFIVLVLRKAIILALILVSPVAFALYCLPNTEKYFRKWWSLLVEWLMVYPIIVVIFAVADILSVTVMRANGPNSKDPLAAMISFVLQFLPLLLIPFAYKLAGGTVGRVHEVLSGSHKRMQEGIKGNPNNPFSLRNKAKIKYRNNVIAGGSNRLGKLREASKNPNASRMNRRLLSGQMRAMQIYDWDRARSEQNKTFDESILGKLNAGSDTLERAFFARRWDGPDKNIYRYNADGSIARDANGNALVAQTLRTGRYYQTYRGSDGKFGEVAEGDFKASHALYDGNESMIQTLIKYETGKVPNDQDFYGVDAQGNTIYNPSKLGAVDKERMPLGSFLGNLPQVMKESGLSSNSAFGASVGSFFGTQTQRKELKHVRLDVKDDGWGWKQDEHAFVQDWAENMGTYAGTNSKPSPIKRLTSVYREIEQKRARGETLTDVEARSLKDIQSVAQGYDMRLRTGQQVGQTDEGTPIMGGGGGSGAPGRVNEAINELVETVLGPSPQRQRGGRTNTGKGPEMGGGNMPDMGGGMG